MERRTRLPLGRADATRVLYLDSTTAAFRRVHLRTLAGGAEIVADSGFAGRLAPSGARVVRANGLYELRDRTLTSLGPIGNAFPPASPCWR
jgi:hypothetical protein